MCWRHKPEQYGAIHFHDDDLYDSGWEVDFTFTVPAGLKSGLYAAHVAIDDDEDFMPFVVKPPKKVSRPQRSCSWYRPLAISPTPTNTWRPTRRWPNI